MNTRTKMEFNRAQALQDLARTVRDEASRPYTGTMKAILLDAARKLDEAVKLQTEILGVAILKSGCGS